MENIFIGRVNEGRAILRSIQAKRNVLITAPSGYGKSTILNFLDDFFHSEGIPVFASKVTPFGIFLKDIFEVLQANDLTEFATLKEWKKVYPTNDERARYILQTLKNSPQPIIILVDDASGLTASQIPWLTAYAQLEKCTFVICGYPEQVHRSQFHRLWVNFDRIDLPPFTNKESAELADRLCSAYGIVAEDEKAYKANLISLGGGIPGEIVRLVRYVSTENVIRRQDIGSSFAGQRAAQSERGIVYGPILLVFGAVGIITKYLGLARGEMDMFLMGGMAIAFFMVFAPWFRRMVIQ